jgi:hypothetical protein
MNELLKKFEGALSAFKYGKTIRPHRDWLILLALLLGLLIGSGIFNAWLFNKVVRGEFLGDTLEVAPTPALDTLEAVKEVLEERRATESFYRGEASFVDPAPLTE